MKKPPSFRYLHSEIGLLTMPIPEEFHHFPIHVLFFPESLYLFLQEKLETKQTEGNNKNLPLYSLHQTIRSIFSDVLYINTKIDQDLHSPWIFIKSPIDIEWVKQIIEAWLSHLMDISIPENILSQLEWKGKTISIFGDSNEESNLALLPGYVFDLFPRYLATKVSNELYIECLKKGLKFVPIHSSKHTELISFPPESCSIGNTIEKFSYKITLTLQTVPFDPNPKIYIHIGIVNWITNHKLSFKKKSLKMYIKGNFPWVIGENQPSFTNLWIKKTESEVIWANRVEELLTKFSHGPLLPQVKDYFANPGYYFKDTDNSLFIGTAYSHNIIEDPKIKSGAGFPERYEIAVALIRSLETDTLFSRIPRRNYASLIKSRNLKYNLPPSITILIYYSDPDWAEVAKIQVEEFLLREELNLGSNIIINLLEIKENLDITKPKKGESIRLIQRKSFVKYINMLEESTTLVACLFELPGANAYKGKVDPKHLLRLAFGFKRKHIQFIQPLNKKESVKIRDIRFENGFLDLMRQIGVIGKRTIGLINDNTLLAGLWVLRRTSTNFRKQPLEIPILVCIMYGVVKMCMPGHPWMLYSEGMLLLAQQSIEYKIVASDEIKSFLSARIRQLKADHIVLFVHAQNIRKNLPEFNNQHIEQIESLLEALQLNLPNLSIVRTRDEQGNETPEWVTYGKITKAKIFLSSEDEYIPSSYASGIFEANPRLYFSLATKPDSTSKTFKPNLPKVNQPEEFIRRETAIEICIAKYAIGSSPLLLAKLTHDLRKAAGIQFSGYTSLPLPLHLASKAKEYAFSFELDNTDDVDEIEEEGE